MDWPNHGGRVIVERQGRGTSHVHRRTEVERQGHRVAGKFSTGAGVGGDIEDRRRIVLKAIRGDNGAGDHIDVTETLDRAMI